MNKFSYKIYIEGCDETDRHVIEQAVQAHLQNADIVDDISVSDVQLAQDMIPTKPWRVGDILDLIEREIFNNQYPDVVEYGDYRLTWKTSQLCIGDQQYDLSDREKTLVAELLLSKNTGCMRDYLLEKIWGYRPDLETHALETQIYRLRQKIENEPDNPKKLVTIGGGYKFQ